MSIFEEEIKRDLSRIACSDFNTEMTMKQIIASWHSAKGVELCKNANYPQRDTFEKFKEEFADHDVFVDDPCLNIHNKDCVLYNTISTMSFEYPEKVYDVILYDDCVATIKAANFAVVNIHNLKKSVLIIEKDDSSIVNVD